MPHSRQSIQDFSKWELLDALFMLFGLDANDFPKKSKGAIVAQLSNGARTQVLHFLREQYGESAVLA